MKSCCSVLTKTVTNEHPANANKTLSPLTTHDLAIELRLPLLRRPEDAELVLSLLPERARVLDISEPVVAPPTSGPDVRAVSRNHGISYLITRHVPVKESPSRPILLGFP